MKHTITLVPGDGIGPEVTAAVVSILEQAGLDIEWEPHLAGAAALDRYGVTLPDELLDSIRRNKVALKGPLTTPVGGGFTKRVTAVHKANIMKMGDGLFLASVRKVAADYPDITADDRIVDAACMHLVIDPTQFDVLLLPNLYGDIVSDLCAGLVGGLGVVPGANLGTEIAVFEAVHGSAPDIAGKNLANPTALLLSAVLMLRHIDEHAAADCVMQALDAVLTDGRVRTRDLGGRAGTTEFADAIARRMV